MMHKGPQRRPPGLAASSFGHTDWEQPFPLSRHCLSLQSTGCWEGGRGSAFNPGNPSQGELTFEDLHSLLLSWPLSTLSPTSEHRPSTSTISSHLVTAHVPPVLSAFAHKVPSLVLSSPLHSTFLDPARLPSLAGVFPLS